MKTLRIGASLAERIREASDHFGLSCGTVVRKAVRRWWDMKNNMGMEFDDFVDREPLDEVITFRIDSQSLEIVESDLELRYAIAYHLDCCPVGDKPEPFKPDPTDLAALIPPAGLVHPDLISMTDLDPGNFS